MLELGCKKFAGKLELEQWRQGPELWQRVDVATRRVKGSYESLPLTVRARQVFCVNGHAFISHPW